MQKLTTYVSNGFEFSPTTEDEFLSKTCGMLGANPPSLEKCGRPATVKAINSSGNAFYWCDRCRKEYWPDESEIAANEKERAAKAKIGKAFDFVWAGAKFAILVGAGVWLVQVLPSLVLQIAGGIILGGLILNWMYSRIERA